MKKTTLTTVCFALSMLFGCVTHAQGQGGYEMWLELDQNRLWPGEALAFDFYFHNGTDATFVSSYTNACASFFYAIDGHLVRTYCTQQYMPLTVAPDGVFVHPVVYDEPLATGGHTVFAGLYDLWPSLKSGVYDFSVEEPDQLAPSLFLTFEDAIAPFNGAFYSDRGVKFLLHGSIDGVDIAGESPDPDPGYSFMGRQGFRCPPAPGQYLVNFDRISFYRPARCVSFKLYADAPGTIGVYCDGVLQAALDVNEPGWLDRIYLVGDGAIETVAFTGDCLAGLNNLAACFTCLPGDANGDGAVDIEDFVRLKQHYGGPSFYLPEIRDLDGDGDIDLQDTIIYKQTTFPYEAGAMLGDGDFNTDGTVDIRDFVILKQNYGAGD